MANRRRDYKAEEARRNAKAQALGWRSRSAQRYAKEKFAKANLELKAQWARFRMSDKGLSLPKDELEKAFRAYYQGVVDPRTNKSTASDSPKAEWFVEWWESVPDYETWAERYANRGEA